MEQPLRLAELIRDFLPATVPPNPLFPVRRAAQARVAGASPSRWVPSSGIRGRRLSALASGRLLLGVRAPCLELPPEPLFFPPWLEDLGALAIRAARNLDIPISLAPRTASRSSRSPEWP
jgi:hypothetical protein